LSSKYVNTTPWPVNTLPTKIGIRSTDPYEAAEKLQRLEQNAKLQQLDIEGRGLTSEKRNASVLINNGVFANFKVLVLCTLHKTADGQKGNLLNTNFPGNYITTFAPTITGLLVKDDHELRLPQQGHTNRARVGDILALPARVLQPAIHREPSERDARHKKCKAIAAGEV